MREKEIQEILINYQLTLQEPTDRVMTGELRGPINIRIGPDPSIRADLARARTASSFVSISITNLWAKTKKAYLMA